MMTGVVLLLCAIAVSLAFEGWRRARNGRIRAVSPAQATLPEPVAEVIDRDAAVTLVQLSTAFCSSCHQVKSLLEGMAGRTGGLAYAELDVTDQPSVASSLGVLRAPTTLALAANGTELLRVGGLPRQAELLDALRPHLP
jgi:thioredoxin-like negative regulator of GroEL